MSLQSLLIAIIIINQIYVVNLTEIVSISFNTFFNQGQRTDIFSIDDLAKKNLYSKINIGEPSNEIKAFLSVQHSYFSITPKHITKNINEFGSHYDITKSNSFKDISYLNSRYLFDAEYDSVAKEKFKINIYNYKKNEHYNISIDDMIFMYKDNNKEKKESNKKNSYYLNIGLQIINQKKYKEREKYNFINQLKKRRIIEKYDWCLFFEKGKNKNGSFLYNPDELINAKGKLLIGDLPNNYAPYSFHENQLLTTYSKYNSHMFKWGLEFSKIYYNKTLNDSRKISIYDAQININNYIILAPMIYFHNIKKDFFDYYISKKICNIYHGKEYRTFYCQKSDNFNVEHLKKFPTLYMVHKEFQYTFEFTYEDLFMEKDNKYWFLVALSIFNSDIEEWFMGIIFLRKYNLIFNQDTKTISFYNTNLPIINTNEIINKKLISSYFILFIIIFSLILISIRYIGKKICKLKEKKRLNHINDFDYSKHEHFNINNKSSYQLNLLMEMKGLIYS